MAASPYSLTGHNGYISILVIEPRPRPDNKTQWYFNIKNIIEGSFNEIRNLF